MSKKKRSKEASKRPIEIPQSSHYSTIETKDASFWEPFERYNRLNTIERTAGLKSLGFEIADDEVLRVLTKSHFVIPGLTRFECQKCGECCRYARKIATLTYESCSFLNDQNICTKHDSRYQVCKWFPFWIYHDKKLGPLLTIKPYCRGYGLGQLVDYKKTAGYILNLAAAASSDDDGAVVMHELIHLPGAQEWAFPSRENIDILLMLLSRHELKDKVIQTEVGETRGELNYAQLYTSGLLGAKSDPQLTVNTKNIITDANEPFCHLFRQSKNSLIGHFLPDFFVNPESLISDLKTCFYRGKLVASPHRLKIKDQASLPALIDSMVYRDRVDGLIHGALISLKETSNVVYNELNQSRSYVRGLIEASLDPFMVIDLDGTLSDVNQAFVSITDYSREALLGSPFSSRFANAAKAQKGVDLTLKEGLVNNYELDLLTSGRELIPVAFNATVFRNQEGIVQGIFAVARDIRDTRRMIKMLEDSKYYARELIESGADLMVTVNRAGVITDVNQAAIQLSGYSRQELIGSPFSDCFENPQLATQILTRAFAEGKVTIIELVMVNKLKTRIPLSLNANVYHDAGGSVQGVFAVGRDIRERLKMVQELEESKNYARELIESSIDLMVTVDCDGRITDVNEAAVLLTGSRRTDLIGSAFATHFTDSKLARQYINSVFENDRLRDFRLALINQKGETFPLSFNAGTYRNAAGKVSGVFAVARDLQQG